MNQFDVFRTSGEVARLAPYLVLLQNDLLSGLASVVVAPLRKPDDHGAPLPRLHPTLEFLGERYVFSPEQLVSLPRAMLGPRAGSLADQRDALMAAVDVLFIGF